MTEEEKTKAYEDLCHKIMILFAEECADPNIAVHSLMAMIIKTVNRMHAGGFGIKSLTREEKEKNVEIILSTIKGGCGVR